MEKVPVGQSIAHAYEFLFGRFFQIIGTAWLPAILYAAGYYVLLSNAPSWVNANDPASGARSAGILLLFFLVTILLRAVIAVSLTQEALGVRKDLTMAHLVVGPRELRLFFGLIRYYLLVVALYAVVLAICFGLLFAAKKFGAGLAPKLALYGTPAAVIAAVAFDIILLLWFWLSMLRLLFLLAPAASVEHKLRLTRAWELTRGSTLRTVIVLVAVFLPVIIAAWAASRFALHASAIDAMPHDKPAEILVRVLQFYGANAFFLAALSGGVAILNGALLAGASAAAYRAVTGHEDPEPEDDAALVAPLLVSQAPQHVDDAHGAHGQSVHVDDRAHGGGHVPHDERAHVAEHDTGGRDAIHANHDEPAAEEHGHATHDEQGHGGHEAPVQAVHGEGHHQDGHVHGDHGHDDHGGHGDDAGLGDAGGHHAAMPGGALDPVGIDAATEARAA